MAFCKYCGRKLEDGEVCHCHEEVNTAAGTAFESKTEGPNTAPSMQQAKEFGMAVWKQFLLLLKAPATNAAPYIRSANVQSAVFFMVLHALCSSLFALICVSKINGLIGMGGSFTESLKFSGAGAFFQTLCYSLILAAALSGLYLLACKLMHCEIRFQEALCIASMRSVISIPVVLVSCVLMLLNIPMGIVCYYVIATLAGVVFLMVAGSSILKLAADRKVYFSLAVIVVFMVVALVFAYFVSKNYFPAGMKDFLSWENLIGSIF